MSSKNFIKDIEKIREKIKKGPADTLLSQKPFADGMYRFSMFIINYYTRVKKDLKIDFDSFMIVQTTVSHTLYQLRKKNKDINYEELETEWEKLLKEKNDESLLNMVSDFGAKNPFVKLTMSSICLVTELPKETVRRKINELSKKSILKVTKKNGVILGSQYGKIFESFVPETVSEVSKLTKNWQKIGLLKSLLTFKI